MTLLARTAPAQPPTSSPPAPQSAEWDKLVVDALKQAHNKGADLYNAGDPAGAYRLYQGALTVARSLLAHQPAVQKLIDGGFADAAKTEGQVKLQAFRLHEVIEQVRAELKNGLKKEPPKTAIAPKTTTEVPRPMEATKPVEPLNKPRAASDDTEPMPRPADTPPAAKSGPKASPTKPDATAGTVGGKVTLDGKPAAGAEVTFVTVGKPEPRLFSAVVNANGLYAIDAALPPGSYAVMVVSAKDGAKVPAKFETVATSGITAKVVAGPNALDFDLKGP